MKGGDSIINLELCNIISDGMDCACDVIASIGCDLVILGPLPVFGFAS